MFMVRERAYFYFDMNTYLSKVKLFILSDMKLIESVSGKLLCINGVTVTDLNID